MEQAVAGWLWRMCRELHGLFRPRSWPNFSGSSPDLRCVVLNACYSEQQAHVIHRHIDYVIGMQKEIADTAAINFSRGFYDALFAGEPVHRAFDLGKMRSDLKDHRMRCLHRMHAISSPQIHRQA